MLIMIDSLTCGGAEKSLISLLPFLSERDYEITLMLRRRGGIFEQYVPDKISIVPLSYTLGKIRKWLYSIALRLPIIRKRHSAELYWKIIGAHLPKLDKEYDVAIAYQQGFPTFYVAEKVKAKKKLCWVNVDLKAAGYSPAFCQKFYHSYDYIAAVSDVLRDKIIYPAYVPNKEKIFTCWDIINEELIRKMAVEFALRAESDQRIHITTVGRLVGLKGYDMAVKAARILKDEGVDFIWHFVGNGSLWNPLKNLIESEGLLDNVILEGEQLNPYPFIAAADVYVQTSRFEGFGLTIGEAKILGKPIVSTNFPVVYNQLTDGKNGIVVEMTPEAIARGILRLLRDERLRNSIVASVKKEHNTTVETESVKVINLIESE